MNYTANLTVAGLRELLASPRLRPDDLLAKIRTTGNLAIIRDDIQVGYVDLFSGGKAEASLAFFEDFEDEAAVTPPEVAP